MSDSITNTNTKIANTVEDFFAELLKLLDQSDIYDMDAAFLKSLGKDGQSPNMICVDTVIVKRMVKEMEAKKIPYMQFRIRATGKDIILVSPENMQKMRAIENSIRIHAGLELDTKAELDRALAISEPGAKEYIIEGLTEYEADKILTYSANAKKPFVVVKEEMGDGKFLVATHEKNKVAVNYYAATSMFEDSNVSKEMASIVEGQAYLTQQRKEIEQAVDRLKEENILDQEKDFDGYFSGFLPSKREFEFITISGEVLRGRVDKIVKNADCINKHLGETLTIRVVLQHTKKQTRFTLYTLPQSIIEDDNGSQSFSPQDR